MRRILGWIGLSIGVVVLAGGALSYLETRRFLDRAERAEGAVIRVDEVPDSGDGGTSYRPVVVFRTRSGAEVEFASGTASNPPSHAVGDAVGVYYEPAAPDRARIDGFLPLWSFTLICEIVGGAFVALGAVALLNPWRPAKAAEPVETA